MAKPVKPAKKKKSGNLLVHVVLLLLLATVGWRLYALQGQVRAAQAEQGSLSPAGRECPAGKRDAAERHRRRSHRGENERTGPGRTNSYLFLDRSN